MAPTERIFDPASLFEELLARFPETARVESGSVSCGWLTSHAADIQVRENAELSPEQVVLLDEKGRRLVTVDVTRLPN